MNQGFTATAKFSEESMALKRFGATVLRGNISRSILKRSCLRHKYKCYQLFKTWGNT